MEPLIIWSAQYSVGIKKIDQEHKKLIDILNRLNTSVQEKKADKSICSIIDELIDYTEYHFETEESLLEKHNYPDLDAHKAEHRKFTRNILEFKQQFSQMKEYAGQQVLDYLKNWLINHILASDKAYEAFLAEKETA